MRIRNATKQCLVLLATAALFFAGCGKSKKKSSVTSDSETERESSVTSDSKTERESRLAVLEIFVDKNGRVAFPDELQEEIAQGEIVISHDGATSLKYVDDEKLRKRVQEFAIDVLTSTKRGVGTEVESIEEEGGIKVKIEEDESIESIEDEIDRSIAKHLFINAHPEARHQDVCNVIRKVVKICGQVGVSDLMTSTYKAFTSMAFTLGTINVDGKNRPLVVICPAPGPAPSEGERKVSGKSITIRIVRGGFLVAGNLCSLADIDLILKNAPCAPQDIHVFACCPSESSHRQLIALLSVCAKHDIPGVYLLSM